MICKFCNNLQHDKAEPYRSVNCHLREIETSARTGCPYCNFIVDAASHLKLDCADEAKFGGAPITIYLQQDMDYQITWTVSSGETEYIQLYTPIGHPPAWPGIPQGLELSPSPSSPEAYAFIRACVQECNANHPSCKTPSPKPPTRLIDVSCSNDPAYVRLVEASSLPLPNQITYIALSYCWGTGKTVTTLSTNYTAHKQGLLISTLPQTLQDAISITRNLNQQYLWIDALCIIQDDPHDWEIESGKMATVYRNAYLTIAAGTAAAASEGFLRRHFAGLANTRYQVSWPSRASILAARILPRKTHWASHNPSPLPLDTRGWTMQERLLSTSLIAYSAHELQWTCLTTTVCECGEKEYPLPSPLLLQSDSAAAYRNWEDVVEKYVARLLTKAGDKLPAVSGIAEVFRGVTGSEYVAGLWKEDLVRGLMWYLADEEDGAADVDGEEYIAPTWSWASLGKRAVGSLKMHNERHYLDARKFVARAKVVGAEAVGGLGGEKNPLGRVKGGWVTLRGYCREVGLVLSETERGTREYSVDFDGVKVKVFPDAKLEEGVGKSGGVLTSVKRRGLPAETSLSVSLFFLGNFITINPQKVQSLSLDFLVLGRDLASGSDGKFVRLGLGYSEPIGFGEPTIEDFIDLEDETDVIIF